MTFRSERSSADKRQLHRASMVLGTQVAVAICGLMLLTALAALLLDEHREDALGARLAQQAWHAPPGSPVAQGVWIAGPGGQPRASMPAPVNAIDPATMPDGLSQVTVAGQELTVWTGDRGGQRVSASYLPPAETSQDAFIAALELTAIAGLSGAVLIGALIGRRTVRPLVEAIGRQRNFVTDASHELRSPLAVIQLRAQMLLEDGGPDLGPQRRAELELLITDTKAMADVVTDLLQSARLEHGEHGGEPIDLKQVAADVVTSLLPIADQRSISLLSCETGDAGAGTMVMGARTALRRAVIALVDNALAHTARGGQVAIEVGRAGAHATLSVRDNGEGLDAASAGQLVRRFARGADPGVSPAVNLDGSPVQTERFGLGLALVRQTAQDHGGRLEFSGQRGHGACFTLVLPAAPARQGPVASR